MLQSEILLNQHGDAYINPNWILLDSESNEHLFSNKKLVTNVRQTTNGEMLRMYSNGGFLDTSTNANFGAIKVWFNKNSLANILSLALITEDDRVTMDSWIVNVLAVHISEGHTCKRSGRTKLKMETLPLSIDPRSQRELQYYQRFGK